MASLIAPDFHDPAADAEALYKACKGWGTDERELIKVLGHRTAAQRKQIRIAYANLYQEDLVKRLESELSGDFERAVYRWILDPVDRDAVLARVSLDKYVDLRAIVELACIHSWEEMLAVRRAYHGRYRCSLEEDVAIYTIGDIRKLLVGLVTTFRYEGNEISATLAKAEAEILHSAMKDKAFNEEVIRIITTRSKAQLRATFSSYRDNYGTSLSKALSEDPTDEFKTLLRTAIRCIADYLKYYEKILRNALKKRGTEEDALTRVIVTRAEKDLNDIKELYYKRNSVTLAQAVAKDTSGDYKNFLLALLGKED